MGMISLKCVLIQIFHTISESDLYLYIRNLQTQLLKLLEIDKINHY